jgi:hypothetical protein
MTENILYMKKMLEKCQFTKEDFFSNQQNDKIKFYVF